MLIFVDFYEYFQRIWFSNAGRWGRVGTVFGNRSCWYTSAQISRFINSLQVIQVNRCTLFSNVEHANWVQFTVIPRPDVFSWHSSLHGCQRCKSNARLAIEFRKGNWMFVSRTLNEKQFEKRLKKILNEKIKRRKKIPKRNAAPLWKRKETQHTKWNKHNIQHKKETLLHTFAISPPSH